MKVKSIRRKTKKTRGGKTRKEKIIVDIRPTRLVPNNYSSRIQVIKSPSNPMNDIGGYIEGFINPVEEELLDIKYGKVPPPYKRKVFEFIYKDQ